MATRLQQPLIDVLNKRRDDYRAALDRLCYGESDGSLDDSDAIVLLKEAIEMTQCLRRILIGRTIREIHDAFGAPGDFGYETPVGESLAKIYRDGGGAGDALSGTPGTVTADYGATGTSTLAEVKPDAE